MEYLKNHCPECGQQKIRQHETNLQDFTCDNCGTAFDRMFRKVVKHPTNSTPPKIMNKNEMKARYSIQNQCQLINPNSGNPITGDRIYDRDTVLGEWYDTGNEVAAPKIIQALNEYEALKAVAEAASKAREVLTRSRCGDCGLTHQQIAMDCEVRLAKALDKLAAIRAQDQPMITRKPGGSPRPLEDAR